MSASDSSPFARTQLEVQTPHWIDTTTALSQFLSDLGSSDGQPPRLYVDLEGDNVSRHGRLSLITILREPKKDISLVDITTLGKSAFTVTGDDCRTLKDVLESESIIKVFFDVRHDSHLLFSLYGICVAGIEDVQLMELASRGPRKAFLNSLSRCMENDGPTGQLTRVQWRAVLEKGKDLLVTARGGSLAALDRRPLSKHLMKYCAQAVMFLPHLREVYRRRLCDAWWREIKTETAARILYSQSPSYLGIGMHMALCPPGWLHWNPTEEQRQERTLLAVSAPPGSTKPPSRQAPSSNLGPADVEMLEEIDKMIKSVAQFTRKKRRN